MTELINVLVLGALVSMGAGLACQAVGQLLLALAAVVYGWRWVWRWLGWA